MPKHSCDKLVKDFKNLDNGDSKTLEKLELKTGISREKLKQADILSIQCNGSTHLVGRNLRAAEASTNQEITTQQQLEVTNARIFNNPINGGLVRNLNGRLGNQIVQTIEPPPPSSGADPVHLQNKLTDLSSFENIQASGLTDQEIDQLIASPPIKPRPLERYKLRLAAVALEKAGYDVSSLRESLDRDAPPSRIALNQE